MIADTRPSVIGIGTLVHDHKPFWSVEFEVAKVEELAGLQDGDEVEVTIRKHDRTNGNLFETPAKS